MAQLEQDGETGLVDSLIVDYLEQLPSILSKIESSAVNNDYGTLEREIHSLKSSSSLMGLEWVAERAMTMEYEAREKNFDLKSFADLKDRLKAGCQLLEAFRISRNRN